MPEKKLPTFTAKLIQQQILSQPKEVCLRGLALADRAMLTPAGARLLLENIDLVRQAKGLTDDGLKEEKAFGLANVVFLTKLHNLHVKERQEGTAEARIAVAKHIFSAASQGSIVLIDDLQGYRAHMVFDFGSRQFDGLFENGDGDQVKAALEELAAVDRNVAENCFLMGWSNSTDEYQRRGERQRSL